MYWIKPRVNLSATLGEMHRGEGKRLMVNCAFNYCSVLEIYRGMQSFKRVS